MQRITITIDDDLLDTLDQMSERRGYQSRSEALRDIVRRTLAEEATGMAEQRGYGVLSYVYEHNTRELAGRLTTSQHHHHELMVSTLHVHLNHDECLEVAILKGDMAEIQHFSSAMTAQRGVRHGHLQCIPDVMPEI